MNNQLLKYLATAEIRSVEIDEQKKPNSAMRALRACQKYTVWPHHAYRAQVVWPLVRIVSLRNYARYMIHFTQCVSRAFGDNNTAMEVVKDRHHPEEFTTLDGVQIYNGIDLAAALPSELRLELNLHGRGKGSQFAQMSWECDRPNMLEFYVQGDEGAATYIHQSMYDQFLFVPGFLPSPFCFMHLGFRL